jgi:V/A-type H+/Na+-transporting ATPase subunit D
MRLRHPPGRGGRLWLEHRLEVATTGADLLDRKRRALVQEHRRLRALARASAERWGSAAAEAELWVNRLAVVAGEEEVAMLAASQAPAQVSVRWRSAMGVAFASEAHVEMGPAPATASGGSAAADMAVPAARRALQAAVDDAVTQSALRRITDELSITSRRHRALERRWLPALGAAIARLNDALDELEREEAMRSAWTRRRLERS